MSSKNVFTLLPGGNSQRACFHETKSGPQFSPQQHHCRGCAIVVKGTGNALFHAPSLGSKLVGSRRPVHQGHLLLEKH